MAQLPQEEKAKIAEQVEIFHQEKSKLDAEVAKWDDSGNDIIVLAKQMCMIDQSGKTFKAKDNAFPQKIFLELSLCYSKLLPNSRLPPILYSNGKMSPNCKIFPFSPILRTPLQQLVSKTAYSVLCDEFMV